MLDDRHMKETDADRAVTAGAYRVSDDELRQFVERVEHLNAEKAEIADQIKEVMAEAKARGYCTKTIRKVIAERKKDSDQRAEEASVFELYAQAMGLV